MPKVMGLLMIFGIVHQTLNPSRLGAQEITRRVNCENVWQAVYTAGVVLPRPVSECRCLDWEGLVEPVG